MPSFEKFHKKEDSSEKEIKNEKEKNIKNLEESKKKEIEADKELNKIIEKVRIEDRLMNTLRYYNQQKEEIEKDLRHSEGKWDEYEIKLMRRDIILDCISRRCSFATSEGIINQVWSEKYREGEKITPSYDEFNDSITFKTPQGYMRVLVKELYVSDPPSGYKPFLDYINEKIKERTKPFEITPERKEELKKKLEELEKKIKEAIKEYLNDLKKLEEK